MEEFVVDANGHCFFCLEKCSSQNTSRMNKSGSSHSLQYLSRYLKMNRKKIFNDEDSIPPDLLAKVEKSRLTSQLCVECGRLNNQFSKLFRHLEMTELRIKSCLDRVHKKLMTAPDTDKTEQFNKDDQLQAAATGKRKIVQALRREAMENGFKVLNKITPRIKLRKMGLKEILKKKRKLKLTSRRSLTSHDSSMNKTIVGLPKIKIDEMEEENHISISNQYDNDDDHDMAFDDFTVVEDGTETGITDGQLRDEDEADEHGSLLMSSVPSPLKNRISSVGKFTKSNTGKYICKDCSRVYSNYGNFHRHYRGEHFKMKFRCAPCGREFSQRVQLDNHQRSVHQRVRFKCDRCDVMSTTKTNLDSHRRSVHFGGRFPCNFCAMTFENFKDRNNHMKVECMSTKDGTVDETNDA